MHIQDLSTPSPKLCTPLALLATYLTLNLQLICVCCNCLLLPSENLKSSDCNIVLNNYICASSSNQYSSFLSSWSFTYICICNACCCRNKLVLLKNMDFNIHWDTNYNFACSHTNSYSSCKRMTPEGEILQSTRGFNTDKNHWKKLMDFVNFPFACISTQLHFWFSGVFLMEPSCWQ